MSLLDSLRKGFGFFLLVMGVSPPSKPPKAGSNPAARPRPEK